MGKPPPARIPHGALHGPAGERAFMEARIRGGLDRFARAMAGKPLNDAAVDRVDGERAAIARELKARGHRPEAYVLTLHIAQVDGGPFVVRTGFRWR